MENDVTTERELNQLRALLIVDEQVPVGMVPRLEVALRRSRLDRQSVGWEARVSVACVCFVVLGLWSGETVSAPLAIIMALLALLYPWAAFGGDRAALANGASDGEPR